MSMVPPEVSRNRFERLSEDVFNNPEKYSTKIVMVTVLKGRRIGPLGYRRATTERAIRFIDNVRPNRYLLIDSRSFGLGRSFGKKVVSVPYEQLTGPTNSPYETAGAMNGLAEGLERALAVQ